MSSNINAPTTLLPPTAVSSTEIPSLFEQANDSVHNLKVGGRKRKGSARKSKRRTKRRAGSRRRTAKRTFLSKWMDIRKLKYL